MNYKKMFDLDEKVAVITGGTGGLGKEMSRVLATYGADIVLVSRNPKEGEQLIEEFKLMNINVLSLKADVTKEGEVENLRNRIINEFGHVDILINSAGTNIWQKAEEYSEENWDKVMNVNIKGTFLCCREFGKNMIKNECGKIINISSVRGKLGYPNNYTAYCASKGAVNMYSKSLAAEWAKYNININVIAPTFIKTPLTKQMLSDEETYDKLINRIPLRKIGEPQDLAGITLYFASKASDFITGQIIYFDGGLTATQ